MGDEMASGSTLDGKVAVVTGAAAGIGRATARLYSAEGARVVVADIDAEGARLVADEVSGTAVVLDVADEGEVRSLFEACEGAYGRLDVLVNNAAYVPTRARARDVEVDDWDRVFAINVRGVILCIKHALPLLERQGGSIVNVSSRAGLIGFAGHSAYSGSKFAVRGITEAVAREVGRQGIRVNSICPGSVNTDSHRARIRARAEREGRTADEIIHTEHIATAALGRWVEPEAVAATALFLASDGASAITGEHLKVDCGK
jgi:hypothetical protein